MLERRKLSYRQEIARRIVAAVDDVADRPAVHVAIGRRVEPARQSAEPVAEEHQLAVRVAHFQAAEGRPDRRVHSGGVAPARQNSDAHEP